MQDLESRLKEYREHGVHATKEVQEAAQKVVKDNVRLKGLLRQLGCNDETIENWLDQDEARNPSIPGLRFNEVCLASPPPRLFS